MGCFSPRRYGTSGCMPAVLKRTEASFSGTSGADGIIAWFFDRKKSRYFWRSCDEVICMHTPYWFYFFWQNILNYIIIKSQFYNMRNTDEDIYREIDREPWQNILNYRRIKSLFGTIGEENKEIPKGINRDSPIPSIFENKLYCYMNNKYEGPWQRDCYRISQEFWEMDTQCRLSICVPVSWHQEWENIYQSLLSYTNQSLPSEQFEVNLLINSPFSSTENEYDWTKTIMEINRFKKNFPQIRVNTAYCRLEESEQDIWYIRGILTDGTLFRIKASWDKHIIVSNDADQMYIHPDYLTTIAKKLENNEIEIVGWDIDEDEITHLNHPEYFLQNRANAFLCYRWTRSSGANSAFRVESYMRVGWYAHMNHICGEDVDLGERIMESSFCKENMGYVGWTKMLRLVTHGRRMVHLLTKHGEIPGNHAWKDVGEDGTLKTQKFWPDDDYRNINPEPNFSILEHALSTDESFRKFLKISLKQILKWVDFRVGCFTIEKRLEILEFLADHPSEDFWVSKERWEYLDEMFEIAINRISENDELEDVLVEKWKLWNQGKNILMMEIDKEMLSPQTRRALMFLWIEELWGHILIQQFPIKFTIIVEVLKADKMRKWLEKFLKRMKEKYQQEKQPG